MDIYNINGPNALCIHTGHFKNTNNELYSDIYSRYFTKYSNTYKTNEIILGRGPRRRLQGAEGSLSLSIYIYMYVYVYV